MRSSLDFVDKARTLIERGDPDSLRYASLELRFALEDHFHRVLDSHAPRIPQSVRRRWQPPQLMKALMEFEPSAGTSKVVRFAGNLPGGGTGDWHTLGQYTALPVDRLRTIYNKLGSYLHHSPRIYPDQQADRGGAPSAPELAAIADEISPALASTIVGSLAEVIYFDCVVCGQQVVRNQVSARESSRATCLNPSCNAEYVLSFDSAGLPAPSLDATDFDCLACGAKAPIENRRLEIGLHFMCPSCKADHVLVQKQWGYGLAQSDPGGVA